MSHRFYQVALATTLFLYGALAQTQGTATDACTQGFYDIDSGYGSTYYCSTDDQEDLGVNLQSAGNCNGGHVTAYVTLADGSTHQCSNLPADGLVHTVTCPGVPRGSVPAGQVQFNFYGADFTAYDQFNVVHVQQTSTVPSPTSTITDTSTEVATA